jgi:DNA-binding transcriptional MocR family regulator
MLERMIAKAQAVAAQRRNAQIERLAQDTPPSGITITRTEEGVVLSGKRLRRRLITDPALRSFGR